MNLKWISWIAAACAFGLMACTTANNDASLSLPNAPAKISVGDTITTGPATEKTRDVQGRMSTNSSFYKYDLTSDDTTVVAITDLSVIGKKAGTAHVTAKATDGTGLISAAYLITVSTKTP